MDQPQSNDDQPLTPDEPNPNDYEATFEGARQYVLDLTNQLFESGRPMPFTREEFMQQMDSTTFETLMGILGFDPATRSFKIQNAMKETPTLPGLTAGSPKAGTAAAARELVDKVGEHLKKFVRSIGTPDENQSYEELQAISGGLTGIAKNLYEMGTSSKIWKPLLDASIQSTVIPRLYSDRTTTAERNGIMNTIIASLADDINTQTIATLSEHGSHDESHCGLEWWVRRNELPIKIIYQRIYSDDPAIDNAIPELPSMAIMVADLYTNTIHPMALSMTHFSLQEITDGFRIEMDDESVVGNIVKSLMQRATASNQISNDVIAHIITPANGDEDLPPGAPAFTHFAAFEIDTTVAEVPSEVLWSAYRSVTTGFGTTITDDDLESLLSPPTND